MAIGAYTTTLLMMERHWNFFLTIPIAMVLAGVVALVLAIPSLRVHGDYYVISSFGFQIIVVSILLNWVDLTHGPYGLFGIPRPTLFGYAFGSNVAFFALATVLMLICVVISWRIAASPAGQVLRAVREDETAAASVGKDVTRVKVTIFARDVSIALSRPMDVSITNRLPGTILAVEPQTLPYVRVVFNLGVTQLDALVTTESVERLGLEPGLRAWAMIKTVAIGKDAVEADLPQPRRWPVLQKTDRETR